MIYTEKKLQLLLNDLKDSDIPDNEAYDIADGVLFDEVGLEAFLKSKGIKDPIGYLADRI